MYLSRIEINRHRRETVRALASPGILHAAVEACFPAADEAELRKLWRLDSAGNALYLLLQSEIKPDFTHIIEQFGRAGQAWETKEYDGFLSRLQNDQVWDFRLLANPTHSVSTGKSARGKIVAYTSPKSQRKWLIDRAAKCGFEIVRIPPSRADLPAEAREDESPFCNDAQSTDEFLRFDVMQSKAGKFWRQGKIVTVEMAAFEGVLRITDAKMLADAMKNGIGRAKAYGCGLLTLAPQSGASS
ncbi:MAG: type I-E CRISPR-associated protein Cas6/Cse3/CasE [Clostridiales Family XIII bacterium]|jgi:CRISPR system Cascade subunit CasE|nr:type I-E CRISPR-associated protein Cas6/Cse3/CasE [Clostridiales Family XIII bacterium]